MKFIVGIKILALISLVFGLTLLCVCGWTFHNFWEKQIGDSPLPVPSNATSSTSTHLTKESPNFKTQPQEFTSEKVDAVAEIINDISVIKTRWSEFKRFLLGSNGLALFSGIVQVFTNLLLLCTSVKGIRSRSGCWKCTHFFLGSLLIVSLIVPAVFDLSQDSLRTLRTLFSEIKLLAKDHKLENFNLNVVEVYYAILALDGTVIFILVFFSCCLMRNADYDYEYA